MSYAIARNRDVNSDINKLYPEDRAVHEWYRFVLSFPPHQTLVLLNCLEEHRDERYYQHEQLALAKALVYSISNLHFGPEVGVGPAKQDAPVISSWLTCLSTMANDLRKVQKKKDTPGEVHLADARQIAQVLEPNSIDAVITSPPYPNEKDYTRTTRLESVLLGFIH